ncbi:hypothetical protein QQ020_20725 [Fulvivirgaceae bacterium BMA12]|uniref:Uncharacterized protein n=1 Tax=Agaribacillus aureus TaxID=3051825 RepID=A0ABT8LDY9_9BACT|nr:hypothetical protein [Fulvivirgaceae bacterium BMA12]
MKKYNEKENRLKLAIPFSGIEELQDYKNGIMGVLRQIKINKSNQELINHIRSVYKLLGYLVEEEESLSRDKTSISDNKAPK